MSAVIMENIPKNLVGKGTKQIYLDDREYKLILNFLEYIKHPLGEDDRPYSPIDGYLNDETIKSLEESSKEKNRFRAKTPEEAFNFLGI